MAMVRSKPFRWIDWKLFIAIGFVFLVALAVIQFRSAEQGVDVRDRQINQLIGQEKIQELDAAEDRQVAARNQKLILDYAHRVILQQHNLLTYLRLHGIQIPTRYTTVVLPPALTVTQPGPNPPVVAPNKSPSTHSSTTPGAKATHGPKVKKPKKAKNNHKN